MGKKIKKPLWMKMRPDSNAVLEGMLYREKQMHSMWYERMAGNIAWQPGERETLEQQLEAIAMEIDHLIGREELRSANMSSILVSSPQHNERPEQ